MVTEFLDHLLIAVWVYNQLKLGYSHNSLKSFWPEKSNDMKESVLFFFPHEAPRSDAFHLSRQLVAYRGHWIKLFLSECNHMHTFGSELLTFCFSVLHASHTQLWEIRACMKMKNRLLKAWQHGVQRAVWPSRSLRGLYNQMSLAFSQRRDGFATTQGFPARSWLQLEKFQILSLIFFHFGFGVHTKIITDKYRID